MKVLFIIAQNGFRDEELKEPKAILENAGYDCEVASITTQTATGSMGMTIDPDVAVKDANAADYELVVVVGGPGSPSLLDYPEVMELAKNAKKKAAICLGPMVLAKAGVLNGKKATVFETAESKAMLQQGNATFVREDVVVDGNIVTANGPGAAKAFGEALVDLLQS